MRIELKTPARFLRLVPGHHSNPLSSTVNQMLRLKSLIFQKLKILVFSHVDLLTSFILQFAFGALLVPILIFCLFLLPLQQKKRKDKQGKEDPSYMAFLLFQRQNGGNKGACRPPQDNENSYSYNQETRLGDIDLRTIKIYLELL